jgi:DNA-directed RNA polymerase specialized sigma24 family protein
MENELKQELRKQNMKKRKRDEISLDYILQDGRNTYNLITDIDSTEQSYLRLEANHNIKKAIEILENEEKIYLIELYINNMTKFDITKKYKIGIHKLNEKLEKAYLKLRENGSYKNLL